MALYLGKAESDQTNLLFSETYIQGNKRLALDLEAALHELESKEDQQMAFKNARIVIEQGILREHRALTSVLDVVGMTDETMEQLSLYAEKINTKKKLLDLEVDDYFKLKNATSNTPKIVLTEQEKEAVGKVPVNHENLDTYFDKRMRPRGTTIHSTMRMEVFNFVDGKRSYYDIYKAVLAESLHAGRWYYGTVTLDDVIMILDANVESGSLKLVD